VKLSKNCRYLVRVRDYETVHIEVGAEISHFDVGYTNEELARDTRDEDVSGRITDLMREMLNKEVDRLAREELETVAEWSEVSPNLAEDYLDTPPPTTVQRSHHAKTTGPQPAPSGGLRRKATSTSTKPLRPV
jgi:hypothetical protein